MRLSPRYLEAYKNLANLLKERATWHLSAVRAYRVALSLVPTGGGQTVLELLLNLGEVLQWLGRSGAANASFAIGVARGVWQHPQQRQTQTAATAVYFYDYTNQFKALQLGQKVLD